MLCSFWNSLCTPDDTSSKKPNEEMDFVEICDPSSGANITVMCDMILFEG
jgi:hypothetical protein